MSGRTALIVIVALGIGFGAGYLVRGPVGGGAFEPTAQEAVTAEGALDELLVYRGTGATAARKVLQLVSDIAGGGEAMLPVLEQALKDVEPFSFSTTGFNVDLRNGEVSLHQDRRNALLEAVYRIGGDEAARILIANSERVGSWMHRVTAFAYLGQLTDREDVRKHFLGILKKIVVTHWLDTESRSFMDAARGRLDPEAFPILKEGIAGGWADAKMVDLMGRAMSEIDYEKTGVVLGEMLTDTTKPVPARAAAARILAQMPEPRYRNTAARVIIETGNATIMEAFLLGLRYGRLDFVEIARALSITQDSHLRLEYSRERLKDMEDAYKLIGALRDQLTVGQRERVKLPEHLDLFSNMIQEARKTVRQLEELNRGG